MKIKPFRAALLLAMALCEFVPVLAQGQSQQPKRDLWPEIGNDHYTTNKVLVKIDVGAEIPDRMAYWVPDKDRNDNDLTATELNKLDWKPFNSEVTVDFGPGAGIRSVWFIAEWKNPEEYKQEERKVIIDDTLPTIVLTYPTNMIISQPEIQLQGYCSGEMMNSYYDMSNSTGSRLHQDCFETDKLGWDQQKFDWTKFCFQGFDIALAPGTNSITFHCEVAGNQLSTNIEVVFTTAGDTNPPMIKPIWPTSGMHITSPTFTARGFVDDYTATLKGIISGDGQSNEIDGEVERTGTYWVENIPILAETNELTLIATDAAGNSSSTNLTIFKSHEDIGLVIESLPSGKNLYEPFGVVTGRVKPDYDVYVNGVKAAVEPNGHWRAENVPISAGGTASFDVTTVLTETNIVSKTSIEDINNLQLSTADVGQEPIVLNPSQPVCGEFFLHLTGTLGKSFVLMASTNLVNWTPILTNLDSSASFDFTDSNAANYSCRFFKVEPLH